MTRRHSKGLRFFCGLEELQGIFEVVLSKTGTRLCQAQKQEGRWVLREVTHVEVSRKQRPRFYACPDSMIEGGSLDSLANIAQIWFPLRVEGELRMGEVGMLVADSP